MFKRALIIFIFLIGILLNNSHVFAGTVLSSYKYAWSNNVGYVNLESVVVDDSALSGFAWSANAGWIKFNPAQGGVINDGAGNLSGFAWGESLGWIDFSGVKISTSTGKFSGVATGTLVGTLTFDCPTYCDVRTDWRPVSVCTAWAYSDWNACSNDLQTRTVLSATPSGCTGGSPVLSQSCSSSGSSSGNRSGTNIYPHVNSYNQDLTIRPSQSGTYIKDTSVGQIILDIPAKDVLDDTTFIISEENLNSTNLNFVSIGAELVNSVFYNITAVDKNGNPVHFFTHPITITLPVSLSLSKEENLGVYWFNDINQQWVLIPDAVFSYGKVTFQINHLTLFAIFSMNDKDVPINTSAGGGVLTGEKDKASLPIIGNKKPVVATSTVDIMPTQNLYENSILFLTLILIVLMIILFKKVSTRKRIK